MDLDKIRYFLVLADTLSYTRASQQLYISQSMLSRYIVSLEEELGLKLFRRNSHGVTLTSVGNYLKSALSSLNGEYTTILRNARIIGNGMAGEIRLGIINMIGISDIEPLLNKYESIHPEVKILLRAVPSPGDLRNSLEREQIDFGYGMEFKRNSANISSIRVNKSKLKIVMSKKHPLAGVPNNSLSIKDFADDTFVTPVDDISTAHNRLIERCSLAGIVPNVISVPDIMTVLLWLQMNRGVTFMHDCSIAKGNQNLVFRDISDVQSDGNFYIYWNSSSHESRIDSFLNYIRDQTRDLN